MKYFLCFVILFLITPSLYSDDFTIVTEQYPPFNYKENDVVKGLSVDVVRAAFKEANLNIDRFDVLPWARGYRNALGGKNVFIFGMIRTEKRENLFKWLGAITETQISLYKLKTSSQIEIQTLEDAKKYEIGAIISDAKADFLVDHGFGKIQYVSNERHNLLKLIRGRIELAIWDDVTAAHFLDKEGIDRSVIVKVFVLYSLSTDVYLALSKNSDENLAIKVMGGLKRIKQNGVYDLIHQKYQ